MKQSWKSLAVVVLGVALTAMTGCSGDVDDKTGKTTDPIKSDAPPPSETPGPTDPGIKNATESETKMNCEKQLYGKLDDGTEVDVYTMTNDNGLRAKVITYGAMLISLETPDRDGKLDKITLFRDSLEDYVAGHPYFGCTVGRYANRIAKGKFTLDGTEYQLAVNNPDDKPLNHLHGGVKGFDKQVWTAEPVDGDGVVGVCFSLESPDGDENYPGTLNASVTYSLDNQDQLTLFYSATTDKPTIVNLTNHSYWNLAGAGSGDILQHELTLYADNFLPVDDGLIPKGPLAAVEGTPMDFTVPMAIGSRIANVEGGYDHCYVLNRMADEKLVMVAKAVDPKSGRVMEIITDQPAVQFYTGNFLDGTISGGGVKYEKNHAFCLETQKYPDSPNQPDYPSAVLRPGETYEHVTIHKFTTQE